MTLADLAIFTEVMRTRSFSKVAVARGVAPSSISRAIANLEAALGTRLFQRTTRRVMPTDAAVSYFAKVAPLAEELAQANRAIADSGRQIEGRLRVTASVAFGQCCIVPLLKTVRLAAEQLEIDLLLTDAVVDVVTESVDLAIRLGVLADSTLTARRIGTSVYRVCAAPAYLKRCGAPKEPLALSAHDCLRFPLPDFRARWIFRRPGEKPTEVPIGGKIITASALALLQCACDGLGVAMLPHWLISEALRRGQLIDLFPDYEVTARDFDAGIWAVYPSRTYIPAKVHFFVEHIEQFLQTHRYQRNASNG